VHVHQSFPTRRSSDLRFGGAGSVAIAFARTSSKGLEESARDAIERSSSSNASGVARARTRSAPGLVRASERTAWPRIAGSVSSRSEEHTSELQSREKL